MTKSIWELIKHVVLTAILGAFYGAVLFGLFSFVLGSRLWVGSIIGGTISGVLYGIYGDKDLFAGWVGGATGGVIGTALDRYYFYGSFYDTVYVC